MSGMTKAATRLRVMNRSKGSFGSATNATTFSHAGIEFCRLENLLRDNRFQERANLRNTFYVNAGTSRYVFTADVSVNEVQAFIGDLVPVIG